MGVTRSYQRPRRRREIRTLFVRAPATPRAGRCGVSPSALRNPGSLVAEPAPTFAIFDSLEMSVRPFECVDDQIVERATISLSRSRS
jgi:hypothetical protein